MPGKFEAPRGGGARKPNRGKSSPDGESRRSSAENRSPGGAGRRAAGGSRNPGAVRRPRAESGRHSGRRSAGRRRINPLLPVLAGILLIAVVLVCAMCGKNSKPDTDGTLPGGVSTEPTETAPSVVASATVASQGDLLMHRYIFADSGKTLGACYTGDGTYNFDSIFQYVSGYISSADYSVINLETTFGGDQYPYQGNPNFNCPDALADSVAAAGYDMLLTANNHCCDTTVSGVKRTVEQVRARNLAALGTQLSDEEKKYLVVDINGIRIGMLCYTYAAGLDSDGVPNLNFNASTRVTENGIVNYFTDGDLDKLYREVETHLENMRSEGAEATMLYIHWGDEYQLTPNATQKAIAQKMCDLGIDVIVGGHPHVMEPVELLSGSTDPSHKTVCIYSLGNAVSNQRVEEMQNQKTGHTEDGAIFSVTFEKNSLGEVYLAGVELIPTWVNKFLNGDNKAEYNIIPLDKEKEDQWKTLYNLTDAAFASAQSSYSRTMEIVTPGLNQCRDYFSRQGSTPAAAPETTGLAA